MILTEEHRINRCQQKELFKTIDGYCYNAKNLSNSVQYLICQCYRIHQKIKNRELLAYWEQEMLHLINTAIADYNRLRDKSKWLAFVDQDNGYIADAYFLSWYMKTQDVYRAMPYSTCSQICIQEKCREWRSFYKAAASYKKDPGKFWGRPKRPGYLDSKKGRGAIVITSQNFSVAEDRTITMPGFLRGISIRARHENVRQIRVITDKRSIRILLMYKQEAQGQNAGGSTMGIDLGVDNLITAGFLCGEPLIINGRPLKSINRYYNKKKAALQEIAKKSNRLNITTRMERLTEKRNRKVKDYLHKASAKAIGLARKQGVSHIVIGNNRGWKQKVDLGKRTNQAFVSIPYKMLIDMICYKAELSGIRVSIVKETYTSGTSYLDGESPDASHYDIQVSLARLGAGFGSAKADIFHAESLRILAERLSQ